MLENVLDEYGLKSDPEIKPFANGLINRTWKVTYDGEDNILQKVNHQIFQSPQAIADNISLISHYLQQHFPHYIFPTPIANKSGDTLTCLPGDGYYRVFPFVKGSHSIDVVSTTKQAYEAAKTFGGFTHLLSHFDVTQLQITLADFHDLTLRYQQFEQAIANGNPARIQQTKDLIQELQAQQYIAQEYKTICGSADFKKRVTHHDTKISNVLFDDDDNSICVIDLDTVMPGYFISDVGDMMRTYLSPVSEEEKDFSQIQIREEYFKAIISGYLYYMHEELTQTEKQHFVYAGKFMIYMQALRFLTDYLNDDSYYGAQYTEQNLIRAQNQATLLKELCSKEKALQALVTETLESFESSLVI